MQTLNIDELEREREERAGRQPDRKSQATELVELVEDLDLVHDGERAYMIVTFNGHREVHAVKSAASRALLRYRYWRKHEKAPNAEALASAVGVIEAKALYDGPEAVVHLRVADLGNKIVLDLADAQWRAVEITAEGWWVVSTPPVPMRRPRGMLALPAPISNGSIEDLRHFVNVATDDDFVLLISWVVAALSGRGPFPIVVLHGEQGSGKTTAAKVLRGLVDPNKSPVRAEPRDPRDLVIAANAAHVIGLDNLSRLQPWLSDGLCRLSTGSGFSTRELYTDEEEVIFEAKRPIVVNGIEELATRGDLLDRSLIVYLPRLQERRDEASFWREYEAARPGILGALLDGLASALRRWDSTRLERTPRMADFARLMAAAEPGLGWAANTFSTAYINNREAVSSLVIEASAIADSIRTLMLPWKGTARELLAAVNTTADDLTKRTKSWPGSPKILSNSLRRIAPNLREVGIETTFVREGHTRRRLICLTSVNGGISPSPSSPSAPSPGNREESGDDRGTVGTQRAPQADSPSPAPSPKNLPRTLANLPSGDGGADGDGEIPLPSEVDWESIE